MCTPLWQCASGVGFSAAVSVHQETPETELEEELCF